MTQQRNKLRIPQRTDYKFEFVDDMTNGYLIIFAIVQNEVYKGKIHEELMFAEIMPGMYKDENGNEFDGHQIKWEDDFFKPIICTTLAEAKKYVLDNYKSHTPHSNGKTFDKNDFRGYR